MDIELVLHLKVKVFFVWLWISSSPLLAIWLDLELSLWKWKLMICDHHHRLQFGWTKSLFCISKWKFFVCESESDVINIIIPACNIAGYRALALHVNLSWPASQPWMALPVSSINNIDRYKTKEDVKLARTRMYQKVSKMIKSVAALPMKMTNNEGSSPLLSQMDLFQTNRDCPVRRQ